MTEVWFYHLERTGPDQALPELLEKTLQRGWKAVVRTGRPERVAELDDRLWTYRDDSFLPHAAATDPSAARQPVVITAGADNPAAADVLFLLDGAEPGALADYRRCVVLFDGADGDQLAKARSLWTGLKGAGLEVSYWRQQGRGWEKRT